MGIVKIIKIKQNISLPWIEIIEFAVFPSIAQYNFSMYFGSPNRKIALAFADELVI